MLAKPIWACTKPPWHGWHPGKLPRNHQKSAAKKWSSSVVIGAAPGWLLSYHENQLAAAPSSLAMLEGMTTELAHHPSCRLLQVVRKRKIIQMIVDAFFVVWPCWNWNPKIDTFCCFCNLYRSSKSQWPQNRSADTTCSTWWLQDFTHTITSQGLKNV